MLDGIMLAWFIMTGLSVLFVAVDVWKTPEANALRWGFIILTVFAGPFAAFFYVLGCREPLPGTHEQYVAATWKQVLGSTMHCASGDGLGIIVGAAIGSLLTLPFVLDFTLEYVLGFGFGWLFFQAFAMKDMAGGDYLKSLRMTFIPEFFSMNLLMSGMMIVSNLWMSRVDGADDPLNASFWFIMSMALIAGFICAYPMNWWLVTRNLKHGMMTVRLAGAHQSAGHDMASMDHDMASMDHDMASMDHDDHSSHNHADHDAKMPASEGAHAAHSMKETPSTSTILFVGSLSVVILAGAFLFVVLESLGSL